METSVTVLPSSTTESTTPGVPSGYTSTWDQMATSGQYGTTTTQPLSTLSSGAAQTDLTTNIAPTVQKANTDIQTQKDKIATAAATSATAPPKTQQQQDQESGFHAPYGYDSSGARLSAPAGTDTKTDGGTSADVKAVMDTPETGYKFAYQSDGTRVEIPISSTASQYGMYDVKPNSTQSLQAQGGIAEARPLDDGTQVARLGNGSYAKLDAVGNVVGTISQQDFNTLSTNSDKYQQNLSKQARAEIGEQMKQIENGSYPLDQWQQDQIDNIKQTYADLIAKQTIANANYEGGTATLQGLLGMSEYSPGIAQGALKAAKDEGIAKIASLNSELRATVGKMTEAFRKDNFDMLKTLYDQYDKNVADRQKAIDKVQDDLYNHQKDLRDYTEKVREAKADETYKDAMLKLQNDQLTLAEKKQIADDVFRNKELSETHRHNLATELEAQQRRLQEAAGEYFDPNTPFAGTIIRLTNGLPKNQRKDFSGNVADAAKRGDWVALKGMVQDAVQNGLPAQEQNKLLKAQTDMEQLSRMDSLIRQYQAAGGDMGLLKGNAAKISTNLGQRFGDGKLQTIATDLNNAFFEYRQKMTGAAFGAKESRDYGSVVPSPTDTFDLALDKIQGAKNFTQGYVDAVYKTKTGEGYKNISGLADKQQAEDTVINYAMSASPDVKATIQKMIDNGDDPQAIIDYYGIK